MDIRLDQFGMQRRKRRRQAFLLVAMAIVALLWVTTLQADEDVLVVVVNKSNPAAVLTRVELRPYFQRTITRWPGGSAVIPINLPEDNGTRRGFDAAVLGLDPERIARYWIDRKIRGGTPAPRKVATPQLMLAIVIADAGAIGYCKRSEAPASVKIVATVKDGRVGPP